MEEDITKPQNQTTNNQVDYDEGNIQTLTGLEHIRLRPGMYIGRLGDGSSAEDGIYVVNAVSSPLDYRQLAETGELLERHFSSVEMVECTDADFSDDENYLFVCRP